MGIKKLLSMAALLVAGGLAQSAWGQEPGTYYIQNVSNGKWLGPYNSWGTQASVLDHADYWKLAKISDGVYTLESVVSNGGSSHYLSGTYCDGGATNLHFTPVDGKENTYNISTAEGSAFLVNSTGTIVDNTGTDVANLAAQWKLYSEDDMAALLNSAGVENPVDAVNKCVKEKDVTVPNLENTQRYKEIFEDYKKIHDALAPIYRER